jgi:trimethylamine--corrinoid protein Co-methyltransferase
LDLFRELGLSMKSEAALALMGSRGIRVEGDRIFPTQKDLEAALAAAPSSFTVFSRNPGKNAAIGPGHPPVVLSCSGVPVILLEDGAQRPVTFDDYRDMLRLTHTSPVITMANSGALYPTWPRPDDALYLQLWNTMLLTDLPLVGQSEGAALSKASVDMAEAATGIKGKPIIVAVCNSLSPLAWDERMLEGLRVFAERRQPVNISCCAMCGATAPVQLQGAIVEANAEVLGGVLYAQLVAPGAPVIYGTTSSVMDMGAMGLALGAPEYSLISAGCAQMAARYDLPFRGGGGLTDAKVLDGQAMAESAWNLLLTLSEGVHFILQATGVLESFMSGLRQVAGRRGGDPEVPAPSKGPGALARGLGGDLPPRSRGRGVFEAQEYPQAFSLGILPPDHRRPPLLRDLAGGRPGLPGRGLGPGA